MLRIAIVTNIIPAYREGFYDRLFALPDVRVKVFCQESIPGTEFVTIDANYRPNIELVRSLSVKRERVACQFLPWRRIATDFDVIFIGGNPRVLSDALFATALELRGKSVVLWTMARSFRARRLTEDLRLAWTRLFRYILVYNDEEADFLQRRGFGNRYVLGMNNGLDQVAIDRQAGLWPAARLEEWRTAQGFADRTVVLSCARLDSKNRFDLMVNALPDVIRRVPSLLWCVIGAGPQLPEMKERVAALGMDGHVHFAGAIYEEGALAPWFLSAKALIHPAAVGLSLLQAFGYALPVVVNDNPRTNGPEYVAFKAGQTGLAYRENDTVELADAVVALITNESARLAMGDRAREFARKVYNVDVMVERFVRIARAAYAGRSHGDRSDIEPSR